MRRWSDIRNRSRFGSTPRRLNVYWMVSACLVSQFIALPTHGADWPQWRGPNRNGVSSDKGWLTQWPPPQVWTANIGFGYSSVAVSEGRLYTMGLVSGQQNVVYCFDANTGTQIWATAYPYDTSRIAGWKEGPRATPTVYGNELYTYDEAGLLCCFNKMTGSNLWSKAVRIGPDLAPTGYGYASSPLVEGNLVIVNGSGTGAAVDRETHDIVWPTTTPSVQPSYVSPVALTVDSQRTILIQSTSSFMGINPANGNVLWSYPYGFGMSSCDPVVYGNKIFLHDLLGGCMLQPGATNVTATWTTNLMARYANAVILGDYAYFVAISGGLQCVDVRNGSTVWTQASVTGGAWGEGPLIAADDKLIIFIVGKLRVGKVGPAGYDEEGRSPITVVSPAPTECFTPPVLANGKIYVRYASLLACYQTGPNPPTDTNHNGIADSWEQRYFAATNCPPSSDSDGDGFLNLEEYIAGTNPTNRNSELSAQIVWSNGNMVVSWPGIMASGAGYEYKTRYYDLEVATNLVNAIWRGVPGFTGMPGSDTTLSYSNSPPDPQRFYRIKVRLE